MIEYNVYAHMEATRLETSLRAERASHQPSGLRTTGGALPNALRLLRALRAFVGAQLQGAAARGEQPRRGDLTRGAQPTAATGRGTEIARSVDVGAWSQSLAAELRSGARPLADSVGTRPEQQAALRPERAERSRPYADHPTLAERRAALGAPARPRMPADDLAYRLTENRLVCDTIDHDLAAVIFGKPTASNCGSRVG